MLGVSLAGFLDSAYLAASHYLNFDPGCTLFNGCETVLTSTYSKIHGVPISLPGAIYYLVISLSCIFIWESTSSKPVIILKWLPILGLAATIALLYIQAFVLHAFCTFCLFSAISSIALFILSCYVVRYEANDQVNI